MPTKRELTEEQKAEQRVKHAAYMKEYYLKKGRKRDRKQEAEYAKQYREKAPDKVRAATQRWRKAHTEEEKEYKRAYHRKHYVGWREKKLAEDPDYFKKRRAIAKTASTFEGTQFRGAIKRKYGITVERYEEMLKAQGGVCAICRQSERQTYQKTGKVWRLSVDHCHRTGAVRGLLCAACNKLCGMCGDDPVRLRAAAEYLESYLQPEAT